MKEDTKKHTPLPKAMEDTTQPIMYIDKKTGFLQVDMMWTCTKCSFAYNKVEATKCEVCNVQRALPKEDLASSDIVAGGAGSDSDIQLVNSEVIKVTVSYLIYRTISFLYVLISFIFRYLVQK